MIVPGSSTPAMQPEGFLQHFDNVQSAADGWKARCPTHDDRSRDSLSISLGNEGRVLLHCFAGCTIEAILAKVGLRMRHLFPPGTRRTQSTDARQAENRPIPELGGLTLAEYARAKRLPESFLESLGLRTVQRPRPAVRIPYLDPSGAELAVRFRLALEGPERFRWRKGSKLAPYGLWRLQLARQAGYIVLVEGESDSHTLWFHEIPALGIPGAASWNDAWAAYLA